MKQGSEEKQTRLQKTTPKTAPNQGVVKKSSFNGWLWAFLVLLALVIGTVSFIGYRVTQPAAQPAVTTTKLKQKANFKISLTKAQANQLIAYYLTNYLKKSQIKYELTLKQQAVLTGKFKFLGAPVSFNLYFDPYVMANGDVELKARQLAVGQLSVPMSFVMNYISHSFDLPKWVSLDSKTSTITLQLTKLKLENGMQITAERLDLSKDQLEMNVYTPLK